MKDIFPRLQTVLQDSSRIISGMGILLDALLEDKGLQQLAESAAQVFRMPVLITDNSYKYLARARGGPDGRDFAELDTQSGYIADSLVQEIQERRIDDLIRKTGKPTLIRSTHGEEYLVTPVVIHEVEVAHISLLTGGLPVGAAEKELLRRFGQVVATELQKNNFFKDNRGTLHASFLSDLFESKINTLMDVRKRLGILGFSLKKNLQVLSIRIRDHIASDARLQLILNQLRKLIPDSIHMIYLGDIVFLISRNSPQGLSAEEQSALIEFLAASKLTGGLSNRYFDILDTRRHYSQSRKAADLGAKADNSMILSRYEDLIVYHIAELCDDRVQLSDLCHPAVLLLRQLDRQQGTDLCETLRVYLRKAKSPSLSSAELSVHRNTLFYRIGKISSLTGIDFDDGDQLMKLSLSLQLLEYLERTNRGTRTDRQISFR